MFILSHLVVIDFLRTLRIEPGEDAYKKKRIESLRKENL